MFVLSWGKGTLLAELIQPLLHPEWVPYPRKGSPGREGGKKRKNIWDISSWDKGCSFSQSSFNRS